MMNAARRVASEGRRRRRGRRTVRADYTGRHRLRPPGVHRLPVPDTMSLLRRLTAIAWALALAGAAAPFEASARPAVASDVAPARREVARTPTAPLLTGFDGSHFPIESPSRRVRRYFDQGMLLVFGFNAAEAARSFEAATAIDPACASCWWALAWALGPNINTDMDPRSAPTVSTLPSARRAAMPAARRRCSAR